MGLLDFFFKKKTSSTPPAKGPSFTISQANMKEVVDNNKNILEGLVFCPTFQLRTPLEVLKKHGEIFRGSGDPPKYGQPRDGIWIPKVKEEFDLKIDSYPASDACGSVKAEEYIEYAVGLLSIFETNENINTKMNRAATYSYNNSLLQNVEKYILKYYDAKNITEVMSRFITQKEALTYYFEKPGYLHLVDGVNKTINNNLQQQGIKTIKELAQLPSEKLLAVKGVGKASLNKILSCLNQIS